MHKAKAQGHRRKYFHKKNVFKIFFRRSSKKKGLQKNFYGDLQKISIQKFFSGELQNFKNSKYSVSRAEDRTFFEDLRLRG